MLILLQNSEFSPNFPADVYEVVSTWVKIIVKMVTKFTITRNIIVIVNFT